MGKIKKNVNLINGIHVSLRSIFRILLFAIITGITIGITNAFFLISLDHITNIRLGFPEMVFLLPVVGFMIGYFYHKYGKQVSSGNDLIFEEIQAEKNPIPFRMVPMIYVSTLLTHLVGGSAGREGTAIQMGGGISERIANTFQLKGIERKLILIMGVSAGFASVFGTPWAGAVFSLEVILIGKIRMRAFLPALFAAYIAHYVCLLCGAEHSLYSAGKIPIFTFTTFFYISLAGIVFGLCARTYFGVSKFTKSMFGFISPPYIRTLIGGIVLLIAFQTIINDRFMGLGVAYIQKSFVEQIPNFDFLTKLVMTSITLGSGFKGGEVTPLFFIGATLGNSISIFLPLSIAFLASLGFVSVFAGSTNTPIASTIMGIEIFGIEMGIYHFISCYVAYFVSGRGSIYKTNRKTKRFN
ncbi:MAG: chloride channel protein [Leptospira sp.]|nr:chloride channel protein [Leptospira sp.]